MKFPRNTRLLRSPFDIAPFAAVFFLLAIFLMLGALLPTPGIPLQLPTIESSPGKDLPGIDKPAVAVAVDSSGRFYFANQIVSEAQLESDLSAAVKNSGKPLTLVIHADKAVTYDQLVHLTLLARDAKIQNVLLATLPRVVENKFSPQ
jgi:biopolymer transport protein ExbD